ncbi:GNAT family N-acetyltransferase [Pseudonocardia zijingensis]|uniref:Ribosomal protein S18-alanine N-acetyltransferase n=1 Tax=Pseudonocardia zijingensis TaxID=153376 RepID=A0ABN1PEU5_9PSEU
MDIEITAGGLTDVDALAPLWTAMVEHHRTVVAGRVPVRPADKSWELRRREYVTWLQDGTGLLFLARREGAGEVVGYAVCRLLASGPTFDLGPERGDVESLAVSPDVRGAGVGTALLDAVKAELTARGCRHWSISVAADNEGAVRLYERVGFRPLVHMMEASLAPGAG